MHHHRERALGRATYSAWLTVAQADIGRSLTS